MRFFSREHEWFGTVHVAGHIRVFRQIASRTGWPRKLSSETKYLIGACRRLLIHHFQKQVFSWSQRSIQSASNRRPGLDVFYELLNSSARFTTPSFWSGF